MLLAAPVRAFLSTGVVVCALAVTTAARAQTVAPPLVEYQERALASFALRNDALLPMTVVIEPFAFNVDSLGRLAYQPFDSAHAKLRLSTTSLQLPPRGSATVNYEVSADSLPVWLVVTSTFIPPRRPGMNIRAQLPHVVYLYQRDPLRREDVAITRVDYDTVQHRVRVRLTNASPRLGRVRDGRIAPTRGDDQPIESFPLFPRSVRWLEMPWTQPAPPARIHLELDNFAMDYDVPPDASASRTHAAP